jgi:hypothetical protein
MHNELQAFLEHPTSRNYRKVRDAILRDPEFRCGGLEMAEVAELCQRGCFARAQVKIAELMPDWALSPRIHFYAAWAARELGDQQEAELEQFLLSSCVQGLLGSGDGSKSHPYLVSQTADVYDVLQALGQRPCRQMLVERGAGRFDVVVCDDGSEIWFDVTDLLRPDIPANLALGGLKSHIQHHIPFDALTHPAISIRAD